MKRKLTNKFNLPEPIVDAINNNDYDKGDADISVTGLIRPPRIRVLEKKHEHEIQEDASERIWSLVGQVMHGILERANKKDIAERRLSMSIDGWKISGGMDLFTTEGVLQDYKFVTVWKALNNQVPEEFEQQLNCYAAILRENGEEVKKLQIVAILRDWSKMAAMRSAKEDYGNPSYPQRQVVVLDVPMWTHEEAIEFIRERVALHKVSEEHLPLCTDEERWAKPTMYAVMRKGRKRAVRLYEDEMKAYEHASEDEQFFVQERKGSNARCDAYCSVAKFCTQYKKIKIKQEESA